MSGFGGELAGGLGYFGDVRRASAGSFLLERVVATGSLVVRRLGGGRAGEMKVHRFLSAAAVGVEEILETAAERTAAACAGRRIVAVQDTTEINFSRRDRGRRGLGPGGDGKGRGFFIHPLVVMEREEEALLGVLHARIWTRGDEALAPRRLRPLEEKESERWLEGAQAAAARLTAASEIVLLADRESDIYSQFARRPASVELIVRAGQDRALADGGRLFAAAAEGPELGHVIVQVAPRGPGDRGRQARLTLSARPVTIRRPQNAAAAGDPERLSLTLVEARETDPPAGKDPLLWRLLTTLSAACTEAAAEVVHLYRLRWRIEQVFRAMKSDGLGLEETQLKDADRLFKLAAVALVAACRTIQLVDARDGSSRPASDVLDPALIEAAEAIGRRLEGKTERQQNPHPKASLAWLAWIIARLGGWTGYYKPPGPKTMRTGWTQFAATATGYLMANADKEPQQHNV